MCLIFVIILMVFGIEKFSFRRETACMKPLLFPALALFATASALFSQTATLKPLAADGFVTLEEIVSDFATDPTAADQKYDGQRLLVYGRVGQLADPGDSAGDPLAVFLQLVNPTTPDVKAIFGADEVPTTNLSISEDDTKATVFHRNWEGELTKEKSFIVEGEKVGIRGTYDSFVAGDIVLENSSKLGGADLAKKLAEHGLAGN